MNDSRLQDIEDGILETCKVFKNFIDNSLSILSGDTPSTIEVSRRHRGRQKSQLKNDRSRCRDDQALLEHKRQDT